MDFALLESMGLKKDLFSKKTIDAQEISLEKDSIVYQSGDSCGAFLIIVSGQIRVEMTCKSGREVTLYRMHEKQTCIITTSVLLNHETYFARATTETPVKAIAISSSDFYKALELSSQFSQYILNSYSKCMGIFINLLDKMASKDISFELNQLLLQQADSADFIMMTQEAIAKELGTAREVISRKLSLLEQEGLIKTHRGKVEIINLKGLQNTLETF